MCTLRGLVVTLETRTAPAWVHVVGLRTTPDGRHAIRTDEHGLGQDEVLCLAQARARILALEGRSGGDNGLLPRGILRQRGRGQ